MDVYHSSISYLFIYIIQQLSIIYLFIYLSIQSFILLYLLYIHICIHTYIFFVFNFDALAQGCGFESKGDKLSSSGKTRIRSWAVSRAPNRQQTECLFTIGLSYRRPSQKHEFDSPSLWCASIQSTWRHCQNRFTRALAIYIFVVTYIETDRQT